MFTTVNPATGEQLETYPVHDEAAVAGRLGRAWTGFETWRATPLGERADVLRGLADLLEKRRGDLAQLMTREMGKPIAQSEGEVDKCAWACRHVADTAADDLAPEPVSTEASRSYVRFDPLGPILAIMPWNFPLWQVFRFAAPALAAGNVTLLKHAPNVTGCALAIEQVFADVGAPTGVLQTLLVDTDAVPDVVGDSRVRGVTLTGSVRAGAEVASLAGRHVKKSVLELGGSDPFVVLEDADLDAAADAAVRSRLVNSGQSCIAAKRFVVERAVLDGFRDRVLERLRDVRVGDPLDRETDVGPLARQDLRDTLHRQVTASARDGAELALGGRPIDRPGFFYEPTLLVDVSAATPAGAEETFGPAGALIPAADAREAVTIANDTEYGLGASVWTRDRERGERLGGELEAGAVFVNEVVKSDPRLPFGGVKRSGYGRELGRAGVREFVNIKSVWVEG